MQNEDQMRGLTAKRRIKEFFSSTALNGPQALTANAPLR
jgi:hypothetical protein